MTVACMITYQRQRPPHPSAHPLVHRMWREINAQRASQEDIAARSGVSSSAMRKWRKGERSPNLLDLEAIFNVLGFELTVKVRKEHGSIKLEKAG